MVGDALARPRGLEQQGELLADAFLADDLVEGARAQRRLHDPLVGVGVAAGQRAGPAGHVGQLGLVERRSDSCIGSGLAQRAQGGAQQRGDVGAPDR